MILLILDEVNYLKDMLARLQARGSRATEGSMTEMCNFNYVQECVHLLNLRPAEAEAAAEAAWLPAAADRTSSSRCRGRWSGNP